MWELDYKESWAPKNWCFWTVVMEMTLESCLDCKEIKLVNPKRNQSWIFIGRTDAETDAPILWPPDVKNWLIGKDPDAGKDWRQEKGMTEDEMVGWHQLLNGHEFEQTLGVGDGQAGLGCCSPWVCKVGHDWAIELNWIILISIHLNTPVKMWAVPGFPGSSWVKNPPSNAADMGLIPSPEGLTCHRATKPMSHNCRACTLGPMSPNYWSPWDPTAEAHGTQLLKPMCPRDHAPHQEKPLQWETWALHLESSSHSLQLETDWTQQWRPSSAKDN